MTQQIIQDESTRREPVSVTLPPYLVRLVDSLGRYEKSRVLGEPAFALAVDLYEAGVNARTAGVSFETDEIAQLDRQAYLAAFRAILEAGVDATYEDVEATMPVQPRPGDEDGKRKQTNFSLPSSLGERFRQIGGGYSYYPNRSQTVFAPLKLAGALYWLGAAVGQAFARETGTRKIENRALLHGLRSMLYGVIAGIEAALGDRGGT